MDLRRIDRQLVGSDKLPHASVNRLWLSFPVELLIPVLDLHSRRQWKRKTLGNGKVGWQAFRLPPKRRICHERFGDILDFLRLGLSEQRFTGAGLS